jgi:mRNA interferase RelE/StbE
LPDFAVVLTDRAIADLDGLALKARLQIAQDIASLARDPLPPRAAVKKLKGYRPPLYRLRVGDYRVLYRRPPREVYHVAEVALAGKPDQEIFAWAQAHQAIIVTFDEDFADQRSFPVGDHHGVIRLHVWSSSHNPVC